MIKKRVAKILVLLPGQLSIRQDLEFAFSNRYHTLTLGATRIVNPLTQGGLP